MIAIEGILSFAWRHWKLIAGGVGALVLVTLLLIAKGDARHYKALWQQEQTAHALDVANYRSAMATAKATNATTVRTVETDTSKITEDRQHDLEAQLAVARAAAADYARRLRTGAATVAKGDPGQGSLPQAASATGGIVGTGAVSVVDDSDLQVCSVNTVKAKGWQSWYTEVRARYDALTQ